jgi:hypothetical protein
MDFKGFAWSLPAALLGGVVLAGTAVPPPSEPAASVAAAPAEVAPAEVAPGPPAPAAHKVLILPPAFTEFQNAVAGLEAIPDWTDAARTNLGDAARDTLQTTGGLEPAALPNLTPEELAILHDHIALAQLIVAAGVQYGSGEWHKHRADFDRSFGDGLRFLHERTGADYALLIDGSQVRQSGGRVAMKWLGTLAAAAAGILIVPMGGGGEFLNVCLLDLTHGTVVWFNSSRTVDVLASSGADMRNPAATQMAMKKLFASYPIIPALVD